MPFKLLKRIVSEKYPLRFVFSRILLRMGIDTRFRLMFDADLEVYTYLHASSAAHKLFIGRYRPALDVAVFKRYVSNKNVVVDVGANIGMFTAVAAKLAPQGEVYAYEATPRTFGYLLDNLRLNKLTNVYPVYGAVCDRRGLVSFYEHAYSHEQNYITNDNKGTVHVPSVQLQPHLEMVGVQSIDFLKVDVEGAELSVLQSLGSLLERTQVVYFESVRDNHTGNNPDDVCNFLHMQGFNIKSPQLDLESGELQVVSYDETAHTGGLNLLAVRTD